jgi:glycerol-3-phosphate acyltransferase PlsY
MQYVVWIGSAIIMAALGWVVPQYLPVSYQTLGIHIGCFLAGYMFGAIPFGILISHLFQLGDLRKIGSGNIGATNVLRTGHKGAAILTLLLDAGKGALVVGLLRSVCMSELPLYIAGAGAVIGHIFPLWLRFHGGKGVATVAGTALALNWLIGLALIGVWLSVFLLSRISSLGAIAAAIAAPLLAYISDNILMALWFILISPLVLLRHKDNIQRILNGKEARFGNSSPEK